MISALPTDNWGLILKNAMYSIVRVSIHLIRSTSALVIITINRDGLSSVKKSAPYPSHASPREESLALHCLIGAPSSRGQQLLYRRICIRPDGLPYLTPSKYSFGAWKSRNAPCFSGLPYEDQIVS